MEHGNYGNCIRQVLRPKRFRWSRPAAPRDFMGIFTHKVFFILVGFFVLIVPAVAA